MTAKFQPYGGIKSCLGFSSIINLHLARLIETPTYIYQWNSNITLWFHHSILHTNISHFDNFTWKLFAKALTIHWIYSIFPHPIFHSKTYFVTFLKSFGISGQFQLVAPLFWFSLNIFFDFWRGKNGKIPIKIYLRVENNIFSL